MPRWDAEGGRIRTTVFECAAFQYTIRAMCRGCGHSNVFQPHALWWKFRNKRWDDRLAVAGQRFRCLRCARGPVELKACHDPVTLDKLPLPDMGEWKRAINRLRS